MQTITRIVTSKGRFALVEVPEDAKDVQVVNKPSEGASYLTCSRSYGSSSKQLNAPNQNNEYQLIATTLDITEQQAAEIVDRFKYEDGYISTKRWTDYEYPGSCFWEALSSFASLLQHHSLNGRYALLRQL